MKNSLGKILFLILLEVVALAKIDLASYSLHANKTAVHLKEAVEIKFEATQQDHSNVMFFFLEAKDSNNYKIVLLQKKEKDLSYHNKKTTFTYLLFPLKSGEIKVDFNLTIKLASDEAVAQVYRGGRNNVKWIETTNTTIDLKPLVLQVETLDGDTELVGEFTIVSKMKDDHIKAYESANITYYLEGTGYDEITIDPIGKIDGVTVFTDVTQDINKATKEGYQIQREYDYALVSDKDFSIKGKEIKCYSTKHQNYYTIKIPPYNIRVDKLDNSNLLDNEDYPNESYDFDNIKNLFIYAIIFLSGFISAKFIPTTLKISRKKEKFSDIKNSKTPKELLLILMDNYRNYHLEKTYSEIESLLYGAKHEKSFKTIKKELLESLR
jgi:hypothetical protein